MKSMLDSKINMQRTVAQLYNDEQARFDVIPIFPTIMGTYNARLTSLDPWLTIAFSDPKVEAEIAKAKKKVLAFAAEKVAMHTGPYAAAVDNVELKNTMNVRASRLLKEKKDRLPIICQSIYNAADAVKVAAAPYGLTQADLDELSDAIEDYETVMNTPRLSHGDLKIANEMIVKIINEIDTLLTEQLDRLVVTFSTSDATLVSLWKTARTIVNPPTTHTSLRLTILSSTDVPIQNARCSLVKLDYERVEYSDTSGIVFIPAISSGNWSLSVTADGFQTYLLSSFKIILKQENTLAVILNPL